VFAGLLGLTAWMFLALPTGFLPTEDQGYVIVSVQLPDAASKQRTDEVVARVNAIIGDTAGVADWLSIGGHNVFYGTVDSNAAAFYVVFKDWEERNDPSLSQQAILAHLQQEFQKIEEAIVLVFPPPAIEGLGVASGFQMQLEDRGNVSLARLGAVAQAM